MTEIMLKIFWDKDNIAFIGNQINAAEHSHCVLQLILSIDGPLQATVENEHISGKCIVINKNARHAFSCDNKICLSILIEPSSSFAKDLMKKMRGNYLKLDSDIEDIQQEAAMLMDTDDTQQYVNFIHDFAEHLGIKRGSEALDRRIIELLEILENCNCYDHTIQNLAQNVGLSSSRLSHLFCEQVGISLKSYILFHQLEKAFTALLNGSNITDAAMLAGFNNPSHFAATVKKWTGMPVSVSIKDSEFLKVFI